MVEKKKVKKKVGKNGGKEITTRDNEKISEKQSKQTRITVLIMIVLLASVFLAHWIVQETKKFEYHGMKFQKEKEGIILYYKSLLGYVTSSGENIPFILKLRNDPRELDEIPVNGIIRLRKEAILSVSPEIANCPDTSITMLDFSRTLKAFGVKASAATTDLDYAMEHNATIADCRSSSDKTVIVMKEGNKTAISQERVFFKNCYIIEIKDCQVQESFERFILKFIENLIISQPD